MEHTEKISIGWKLWAAAGLVCFLAGLLSCGGLRRGGVAVWIVLPLFFCVWSVLGLFLLQTAKLSRRAMLFCLLPMGLAVLIRVLCLDHVTYDYLDFLAPWTEFFRQYGGFAAIRHPVGNYNVPYLYFLAFISYLPLPDLYLIKLFSILFDLLLAYGGLRLARRVSGRDSGGAAAFSILLLLPTVVLNGAYWGQCDSLYTALCLLALADTLEEKPLRGVVLLALAFSFKLQTAFLIPLWCVLWFSGRVKFKHLLAFPVTYFATCLPALLLGKPLGDILSVYIGQTSDYSALTLNAPSIFALIPYEKAVNETLLSRAGILAAFALLAVELLWLLFRRKELDPDQLIGAGLWMALFIPLLLPHMHERYFMLAETLSVVYATRNWKRCAIPLAIQIAGFGGYHAYLVLRYAFPMAWGTYLLLGTGVALPLLLALSFHRKKAETV